MCAPITILCHVKISPINANFNMQMCMIAGSSMIHHHFHKSGGSAVLFQNEHSAAKHPVALHRKAKTEQCNGGLESPQTWAVLGRRANCWNVASVREKNAQRPCSQERDFPLWGYHTICIHPREQRMALAFRIDWSEFAR